MEIFRLLKCGSDDDRFALKGPERSGEFRRASTGLSRKAVGNV
jgi:hypothetical protein